LTKPVASAHFIFVSRPLVREFLPSSSSSHDETHPSTFKLTLF
jgi:hypothetical protein